MLVTTSAVEQQKALQLMSMWMESRAAAISLSNLRQEMLQKEI